MSSQDSRNCTNKIDSVGSICLYTSAIGSVFLLIFGALMLRSILIVEGLPIGAKKYSEGAYTCLIVSGVYTAQFIFWILYKSYRNKLVTTPMRSINDDSDIL
ncbi:hypothetical protein cand_002480 [Cryptosporidium andersoni]|uniref:Uncharacterized protein n=1 Tax=Cryptosporidium andersoni TaxID=117008 RepID=A0A1J4MSM8_9CRYT|nr:hypothetical protein cand_002480 [Cryptosporidium andersoni]